MTYQINETLLKVEGLSMVYDKPILKDINFEIKNISRPNMSQGQVASLVAKSGMGKTQLLRCLAALQNPTAGLVKVFDKNSKEGALKPVKEGDMGVVFQNYVLYEDLTILDNCLVALKFREVKVPNPLETVKEYAEYFELTHHLKKYPKELSGGQRQRVSILQQYLNGSAFLLLDEPFSGLDVSMIKKVSNLLLKISQTSEEQTIIIVSHDLVNSVALSDTVFILGKEDEKVDGAFIKKEINLIERGLAWTPEVKYTQPFQETIKEIENLL